MPVRTRNDARKSRYKFRVRRETCRKTLTRVRAGIDHAACAQNVLSYAKTKLLEYLSDPKVRAPIATIRLPSPNGGEWGWDLREG